MYPSLCFVHVPKTAGTFIGTNHQTNIQDFVAKVSIPLCGGHAAVSEMMKHDHEHHFFTIVREPLQRKVSTYYWDKKHNGYESTMEDYLENFNVGAEYPKFYDVLTPKDFHIVGSAEYMDQTIELLYKMTGYESDFGHNRYNSNPDKPIDQLYTVDYPKNKFINENIDDYIMYHEGMSRFFQLCKDNDVKF